VDPLFADGADVVDYLTEIPLPGRILAPATKNLARDAAPSALPSFVAGPENRLVATTVNRLMSPGRGETRLSVAASLRSEIRRGEDADFQPNIVALFGPSGVGKTHLAHGLVKHWQRERGEDSAFYTTAADFRHDFHVAMKSNRVAEFRDAYRGRRLLAIDDLHRLPNEEYFTVELRHTLDAIEENGGNVIVTSLRPVETIVNLPAEIRSRLASGLSLQLSPPGSEARVRIIRHASTALGHELSLNAASRLAAGIEGTAPQVFSALFELCTEARICGTNDAVRTEQLLAARTGRRPSLPQIIAAVAKYTSIPQKQLKSASRRQAIVNARAIAAYLARTLSNASYDQIGRALGGRDHTTVMHSCKKIERELTRNMATQEAIADLHCRLAVS
jgi:chromosomal replication initiator protein